MARGDAGKFSAVLQLLVPYTAAGADRGLAWDRRVSLAIVLAQARQHDLAKNQLLLCVRDMDAERLRALTPSTLHRLLIIADKYDVKIEDRDLRNQTLGMLPRDLRERLSAAP